MTVAADARSDLLRRYGRWYGQQHFAIAFTSTTEGDDAKRVTRSGWDKTIPLGDGDYGEALIVGRGIARNPVVVVRPSNLIVLECDSEPDLGIIASLELPETITVVSSEPYKRHFYFRPDPTLEQLPAVAFRFESERLTQDSGRYFLCPPAIHPSGRIYSFLPQHGPDEIPIAVLPADRYLELIAAAGKDDSDQANAIQYDANAKIQAGQRREFIFRYACMLRRWGHSRPEIEALCQAINQTRCQPPVAEAFIRTQVDGAMKKQGNQELAVAATPERTINPISARALCEQPDSDTAELVGPIVQAGGRTILVGQTGEGKTTLALQLVRSALNGDPFLDWRGIGQGSALILDLEQGLRSIKRALRDAGLDNRDDVTIAPVPDGLALDRELEHVNELDETIGAGGYSIVVIDPFYKAHQADDPNAERPIVDLMRILDALRAKYGFALILPAHPRKEPPGNNTLRKLQIGDVAGSSAITRGAEIVIAIERVATGYARLRFLKDRDGDLPIGEAYNLVYHREAGYTRDPRDLEPPREYEDEVLAAAKDGKWRTIGEWKDTVNAGVATLRPVLTQLVARDKLIYQEGPPGRARTAKCWRLARSEDTPEYEQFLVTNDVTSTPETPPSYPKSHPAETTTNFGLPPLYKGDQEVSQSAPPQNGEVTPDDIDFDIPF